MNNNKLPKDFTATQHANALEAALKKFDFEKDYDIVVEKSAKHCAFATLKAKNGKANLSVVGAINEKSFNENGDFRYKVFVGNKEDEKLTIHFQFNAENPTSIAWVVGFGANWENSNKHENSIETKNFETRKF